MHYRGKSRQQWEQQFVERAKTVHNNYYDYSNVHYRSTHNKVCIICPKHGEFYKTPTKHLQGAGCPTCSRISTVSKQLRFSTFSEVVLQAMDIHQCQYQYSGFVEDTLLYGELITTNTKLRINCPIHGEFIQTINKHLYQQTGCKNCFNDRNKRIRSKDCQTFIKDSKQVHGDRYDYSLVQYNGAHKNVQIRCPDHGIFELTPANHILKMQGCCWCDASSEELIIRQYLTEQNISFKQQCTFEDCVSPQTGKYLRYDFYLPDYNLLIEYDGIYHYQRIDHDHDQQQAEQRLQRQQYYDQLKNQYAKQKGIHLLRIPYTCKSQLLEIIKRYTAT